MLLKNFRTVSFLRSSNTPITRFWLYETSRGSHNI
jgi:hypothetical protein